jgi:hypothetical protein
MCLVILSEAKACPERSRRGPLQLALPVIPTSITVAFTAISQLVLFPEWIL